MRATKLAVKLMTMVLMSLIAFVVNAVAQTPQAPARAGGPPAPPMTLTTNGWADGDDIPARYTQAGEQVSPPPAGTNPPPAPHSFFLLMHDPHVALNGTTD